MPKQGGGGKAVDAGGSYKGKTVDGVKTKQPTLYRNEQWKSVQAPAIENPRECVGKVVSVDGNFWTGSSLEESITSYDCTVIRYIRCQCEPCYHDDG